MSTALSYFNTFLSCIKAFASSLWDLICNYWILIIPVSVFVLSCIFYHFFNVLYDKSVLTGNLGIFKFTSYSSIIDKQHNSLIKSIHDKKLRKYADDTFALNPDLAYLTIDGKSYYRKDKHLLHFFMKKPYHRLFDVDSSASKVSSQDSVSFDLDLFEEFLNSDD